MRHPSCTQHGHGAADWHPTNVCSRRCLKRLPGTSLVPRWWRSHLPMQETQVPFLVPYPTSHRAARPVNHNYFGLCSRAGESQPLIPRSGIAHELQVLGCKPWSPRSAARNATAASSLPTAAKRSLCPWRLEKKPRGNKDPAQPKGRNKIV